MELPGFNTPDILALTADFPTNFDHEVEDSIDLMQRVGEVIYEGQYVDVETMKPPLSFPMQNSSLAALDLGNYTIEHVAPVELEKIENIKLLEVADPKQLEPVGCDGDKIEIGISANDVRGLLHQFEQSESGGENTKASPARSHLIKSTPKKKVPLCTDPLEIAKKIAPAKRKSAILLESDALPIKLNKKKQNSSLHTLKNEALMNPVRSLPGSRSGSPEREVTKTPPIVEMNLAYLSLEHDYCVGFGMNYNSPKVEKLSLEQRRELYRTKYKIKKKEGSNCSTPQSLSPNRTPSPSPLKIAKNGPLFDKIPDYFAEKLVSGMCQETNSIEQCTETTPQEPVFDKIPSYISDVKIKVEKVEVKKEEDKENRREKESKENEMKPQRRKKHRRQIRQRSSRSQSCGSSASACSSRRSSGKEQSRSRSRSSTSRSRSRSYSRSPSRSWHPSNKEHSSRYRDRSKSHSRSRSQPHYGHSSRSRSRSYSPRRSRSRDSRSRSRDSRYRSRDSRSRSRVSRSRSRVSRSRSRVSRSRSKVIHRRSRSRSFSERSKSRSRSRSNSLRRSPSCSPERTKRKRSISSEGSSRSRSCSPIAKKLRLKYNGKFASEAMKNLHQYHDRDGNQVKEWEDRRVIYIGNITEDTTRQELYRRFSKFGSISKITLHFRDKGGDHYAFITFEYSCDAFACMKAGNDPDGPQYDLCFGGRRNFCKSTYEDLDAMNQEERVHDLGYNNNSPAAPAPSAASLDFDSLLKEAMKKVKR